MNEFGTLLQAAANDCLRGRTLEIFDLRFGFLYRAGHGCSVVDIAERYGMRRDRVRQLLAKCMTRIRWNGGRNIRRGHPEAPCARLVLFLKQVLPGDLPPQAVHNFCLRYASANEWDVAHLVLTIAMPSSERRRQLLTSTKYLIQQSPVQIPAVAALSQSAPSVII